MVLLLFCGAKLHKKNDICKFLQKILQFLCFKICIFQLFFVSLHTILEEYPKLFISNEDMSMREG